MTANRLLAYHARIVDAPDALARLRRFILDLAVRGKLVPQNPSDEPAYELLKRITRAKMELGGLKERESSGGDGEPDHVPFELPANWAWTHIGDICSKTGSGSTPRGGKSVYHLAGVPFLRSQNIYNDGLHLDDVAYIDRETHRRMSGTAVKPGDLLLNITGGSIGRCCLVPEDFSTANISQHVAIMRVAMPGVEEFLHRLVMSPYFQLFIFDKQTGAGRGGLPKNKMDRIPVALPPIPEQRRIVAKIDELMALCARLEAKQAEREITRNSLTEASLARLSPPDPSTFNDDARFAIDLLPVMTARPDQIRQVRRAILNVAVRGKLIPQEPTDEPADELLGRIALTKARLVGTGKISKQEAQPAVATDVLDFDLPRGWVPTRIGDLLTVIRGASPRPKGDPRYFSPTRTPYHWIKISDIRRHSKERVLLDTEEFLTQEGMENSVLLPKGTLVVTNSATIGVPIVLGFEGGCIHDGYLAFPYFPESELSKEYFFILFQTLQSYAVKMARGMAQLNLNTGLVRAFPLGLPPLAEQRRIVAKVDALMVLCDRLEASLSTSSVVRRRLLDALLAEALGAVSPEKWKRPHETPLRTENAAN
jgi:type I restriction enzyme S subunit